MTLRKITSAGFHFLLGKTGGLDLVIFKSLSAIEAYDFMILGTDSVSTM